MSDSRIAAYVTSNSDRFLDELKALVAIPSISTLPEHATDVRATAEFLAQHLREHVGLSNARVIETAGHPLVYAEWLDAPGNLTVLLYGHYDVQPVDPVEQWHTPPFEMVVEGEYLRGRGVADDKGPTFAAVKALETLLQLDGSLPVNVKILIEGEEESGGESIAAYVKANPERLGADCALVLDTLMQAKGTPTLCYALRGIAAFDIVATGAPQDLHSGLYGGAAPNPLQALAWVLADLKGRDGRINIPGFYEMVQPLSTKEQESLTRQAATEYDQLVNATGLAELYGESGFSPVESVTVRPTFEVHGIRGGFTGEGAKTVIPSTATAKVSLRLVPQQQPEQVAELLSNRIRELTPPGVTIAVQPVHHGDSVVLSLESAALVAASQALEAEFGRPVEYVRMGGSIPVVALFDSVLKVPCVLMGFALPDDNFHAPDERFYLPNYYAAIRSVAGFLQQLSSASV